jgi:hypothetical protein
VPRRVLGRTKAGLYRTLNRGAKKPKKKKAGEEINLAEIVKKLPPKDDLLTRMMKKTTRKP